jgi:hypothetical protein
MTEDSGLTRDQERIEHASDAIRDIAEGMKDASPPPAMDARRATEHLARRLRQMTLEAPLQSLLVAFLLGVLVARRR